MNGIKICPAEQNDSEIITLLNIQASGGVIEILLTGLIPNVSAHQMMQHQILEEEGQYNSEPIAESY